MLTIDERKAAERVECLVAAALGTSGRALSPVSQAQLRRWGLELAAACDDLGLDLRVADAPDHIARIQAAVGARVSAKDVGWAIRRLADSARRLEPEVPGRMTFASIADAIPTRSLAGRAMAARLADATTPGQRRVRRSQIGRFLGWCYETGRTLDSLYPGDLHAYRRACLRQGLQPGPFVCEARALMRVIDAEREATRWARTMVGSQRHRPLRRPGGALTRRSHPSPTMAAAPTRWGLGLRSVPPFMSTSTERKPT